MEKRHIKGKEISRVTKIVRESDVIVEMLKRGFEEKGLKRIEKIGCTTVCPVKKGVDSMRVLVETWIRGARQYTLFFSWILILLSTYRYSAVELRVRIVLCT